MAFGMGDAAREYVLKIVADVKDATKGVDEVATKTSTMKDKMVGIGKSVAAGLATGAVIAFGKSTVTAAADADDASDAIQAAFGDSAKVIEDFSKDSAKNLGLSAQDYQQMAALTGAALQSMGIGAEDAAEQTKIMTQRAADMAAIYGGDTNEALQAITKAMAGSTKGLQKYGVVIKSSEVEARAMAKGYVDASGKVTEAGKAIAAQELIIEKTADVQGAWAENSKDVGSQQAILAAEMENLQASIGTKLLPVIVQLMGYLQPLLTFISDNVNILLPLAGIILGIVAAVKAWNVVQLVLNSTLLANPIFQITAAIAALVAGIIWAYNNVGWFRDAVDGMAQAAVAAFNWLKDIAVAVFTWIKDNWPLLLAILTGPFGAAVAIIIKNWDTIKEAALAVFNWIKANWPLLLAILTGPFGIAVLTIQKNWDSIVQFAKDIPGKLKAALSTVFNVIKQPFQDAWNWVKQIPDWIKDRFKWMVDSIKGIMSGVANAVTAPFEAAFNAIKKLWNNTIGGFGFKVPSWVPGIGGKGWEIPKMATGGIITRPTIALLGEAGAEAVIPLNRLQTGQAVSVIINVYALTANAEVGRRVWEALNEYQRTTGNSFAG